LLKTNVVVIIEVYVPLRMSYIALSHLLAAEIQCAKEISQSGLTNLLGDCFSQPKINENVFVEGGTKANVVRLNVEVH